MKRVILVVEIGPVLGSIVKWFRRSESVGGAGERADCVGFERPSEALDYLRRGENGDALVFLVVGGHLQRAGDPQAEMDGPQVISRMREVIGKRLHTAVIFSGLPGSFMNEAKELGCVVLAKPGPMSIFDPHLAPFLIADASSR